MAWKKDVIEIVTAFVIAWLFYQGLVFATGTDLPIVSVVSGSMYHNNNFDNWWEESRGYYESVDISKESFLTYTLSNGLSRGDLLFVITDEVKVGDIVVYDPNSDCFSSGGPIVHRIVDIRDGKIITKGDNEITNTKEDRCSVSQQNIKGKVVFGIPLLGYPRLALNIFGI